MEVLTRESFLHTDFIGRGDGSGYGDGGGNGDGYGDGGGCGDGSGFGCGFGCGDGFGCGGGCGFGCGDGGGFGSGFGSGYGRGDGSGFGGGDGSGFGFGGGCGCGFGLKSINGQTVDMIDGVPTILMRIIGNVAKGFVVRADFSLAPTYVCKQGHTFAHGETLHKAREALLEKLFDDMPTEERIAAFCKEFKPGVKRPATDFFSWHHRLTGSCKQGRREFARQHDVDIDRDEMTPEEFFALTRDSYGRSIIRQTEEMFKAHTESH